MLVIIRHVDEAGSGRIDPVDRAHLTGRSRPTPPIQRYGPSHDLVDVVDRYWFPVWSVEKPQRQSTLQHPACLIVVTPDYARFYGVVRGLSTVVLEGTGWAAGVMLRPAAGRLVLRSPVSEVVDRSVDLDTVQQLDGVALTAEIRAAMSFEPSSETSHQRAIAAYERRLSAVVPVDADGVLVNRIVAWLVEHPEVTRVAEVAEAFDLGERRLQRLVEQRVGLSPKWLIQRRRLHDAVQQLKAGVSSLAGLAAELGYADQAHFTHDFRAVSGMTPGEYLADQG